VVSEYWRWKRLVAFARYPRLLGWTVVTGAVRDAAKIGNVARSDRRFMLGALASAARTRSDVEDIWLSKQNLIPSLSQCRVHAMGKIGNYWMITVHPRTPWHQTIDHDNSPRDDGCRMMRKFFLTSSSGKAGEGRKRRLYWDKTWRRHGQVISKNDRWRTSIRRDWLRTILWSSTTARKPVAAEMTDGDGRRYEWITFDSWRWCERSSIHAG
jgi:hypothetical protein